ncbi:hypothetical protein [Acidisoma sp. L85]|uniref:hypothetical protein n=1 Tax=Acidisoma sp. L85 TaxID=1641850 RepID=UPI00131EA325|nr:hypothetical protein [Acidisoma sp. L85]
MKRSFWFAEFWLRFEAFGNDLVCRFSIEGALAPGVVGGIEAEKQLFEIAM